MASLSVTTAPLSDLNGSNFGGDVGFVNRLQYVPRHGIESTQSPEQSTWLTLLIRCAHTGTTES